jgi:hypothetical protein
MKLAIVRPGEKKTTFTTPLGRERAVTSEWNVP